jgi:hypothetical protein
VQKAYNQGGSPVKEMQYKCASISKGPADLTVRPIVPRHTTPIESGSYGHQYYTSGVCTILGDKLETDAAVTVNVGDLLACKEINSASDVACG